MITYNSIKKRNRVGGTSVDGLWATKMLLTRMKGTRRHYGCFFYSHIALISCHNGKSISFYMASVEEVGKLLAYYWTHRQPVDQRRSTDEITDIQNCCKELWERDYHIERSNLIPSLLCSSYPKYVYVPTGKHDCETCSDKRSTKAVNSDELFDCFCTSSNGRARGRFIAPVILIHLTESNQDSETPHTRYIFRSGALIQPPEAFLRSLKGSDKVNPTERDNSMKSIRREDKSVMTKLGVGFVFDLMVEEKLSKFFGLLKCVSSEKSVEHDDLYSEFDVLSVPFPGYELFSRFNKFCRSQPPSEDTHHIHYQTVI